MPRDPYAWIADSLVTIHRADWYRSVQTMQGRPGPVVRLNGCQMLNFASNDYLGLAGDERLIQAAVEATRVLGTGTTGSRLLSGHRELHRQLEQAIARWKRTEDAIVFSSGYLANLGAITALVGSRDLILADRYNHASLKQGARLSGAMVLEYNHCDLGDLEQKLAQQRDRYRRCLILSDSVFSMDGDLCPLPVLLDLATQFESMVMVDEAHGTGVFGTTGAGCVEHFRCTGRSLVQMGTLSKALGSLGGYVAGTATLVDFLRNRASSWIYTTGLSPADTAAALTAVTLIHREPERRESLWRNIATLKRLLNQRLSAKQQQQPEMTLLPSGSPIFCLQLKDPATALALGCQLKTAGVLVSAVRPPTVPTSRIRISVMATHTTAHCGHLVDALGACQSACQSL